MLQIHFIRENKEEVITRLAKKNFDATAVVELVVELDEKRRNTQVELDNLLAESNKLSKDIGEMMKNGEKAKAEILKEKTTQIRENSKQLNESLQAITNQLQDELYKLPNLPKTILYLPKLSARVSQKKLTRLFRANPTLVNILPSS